MKRILLGGLFACLALGTGACSSGVGQNSNTTHNTNSPTVSPTSNNNSANSNGSSSAAANDKAFMTEAANGGMAEVELGKLAASKAANAEVKKFAQMMVDDHSKANAELKTLAGTKNVTLPAEPDAAKKSTMDSLKALTGADFDNAYVKEMVEDHEKDVAKFEEESKTASDPDVKAFAAKTLPTLKLHLEAIKAIQAKMK